MIYFTLIDFLLQLVFLGLFVFVITSLSPDGDSKKPPGWVFQEQYLPLLNDGLSPFIRANEADELRRVLENINKTPGLLESLLNFLQSTKNPRDFLVYCAKNPSSCSGVLGRCEASPRTCKALVDMSDRDFDAIGGGAGKPFCISVNKSRSLFTLTGKSNELGAGFLHIDEISEVGHAALQSEGISVIPNQEFTPDEFRKTFAALGQKNCVHVIKYRARSDSLTLWRTLDIFSVATINE